VILTFRYSGLPKLLASDPDAEIEEHTEPEREKYNPVYYG